MVLPGVASIPNSDVEAHPLFRQCEGTDGGILNCFILHQEDIFALYDSYYSAILAESWRNSINCKYFMSTFRTSEWDGDCLAN
jgi:hypothetical protein